MENSKLPRELLIEILARLPVKSLLRFKSVCKFFYSLIKSDYHFKHKHNEISRAKCDYVIFEREIGAFPWPLRDVTVFGLVYKESDCDEIQCVDLVMPSSCIRKVMCVDGILCVTGHRTFPYILIWNPSTREIKALPPISAPDNWPSDLLQEVIGFGFCNNMTGKVVIVWKFEGEYKVMVCNQVGNLWVWRQINPHHEFGDLRKLSRYEIYLKGKYYWYLFTYQGKELKHYFLCFDMNDESFGKVNLPSNPRGQYENGAEGFRNAMVSVMNDTIALLGYREDQWEVWLMEENNNSDVNWHKYASFECREFWQPMQIWNQNRHLLIWRLGNEEDDRKPQLVSIDLITGEKKENL